VVAAPPRVYIRERVLTIVRELVRITSLAVAELKPILEEYFKKQSKESEILSGIRNLVRYVDQADQLKRRAYREATRAGALLTGREHFLSLTHKLGEIVDQAQGLGYRVYMAHKHKIQLSDDIGKAILPMVDDVNTVLTKLKEAVLAMCYGTPERVLDALKEVDTAENRVDERYRELLFTQIYIPSAKAKRSRKSKSAPLDLATLFLTKELLEILETIADRARDAAEIANLFFLLSLA